MADLPPFTLEVARALHDQRMWTCKYELAPQGSDLPDRVTIEMPTSEEQCILEVRVDREYLREEYRDGWLTMTQREDGYTVLELVPLELPFDWNIGR
jgi:hypothetical protein